MRPTESQSKQRNNVFNAVFDSLFYAVIFFWRINVNVLNLCLVLYFPGFLYISNSNDALICVNVSKFYVEYDASGQSRLKRNGKHSKLTENLQGCKLQQLDSLLILQSHPSFRNVMHAIAAYL